LVIDTVTLLDMLEAINPAILQDMERVFRPDMSHRRETSAT